MQAVILAAGRGTRMVELTESVPKPMLDVAGKPLLQYKFEALPEEITEVVLVIGYRGETIRNFFGERFDNKNVAYVEQDSLNGTAGALWTAKDLLHDRFLIMAGDDIYAKEDVAECIKPSTSWKMLVQQLPEMHRAGSVIIGDDGNIVDIIESTKEAAERLVPGLASTSLFVVDTRLFDHPMVPKAPGSLEYGHPQSIVATAHKIGVPLEPVYTDKWIQVTAPKDLIYAAEVLAEREKEEAERNAQGNA